MGGSRLTVVAILVLVWTLGVVGTAAGQTGEISVSMVPPAPVVAKAVTITTAGTTSDPAQIFVYDEGSGTGCGATQGEQQTRPTSTLVDIFYPSVGSYSFDSQYTFKAGGAHRLCAYHYLDRDNPGSQTPRALATITLTVAIPAGADKDGDLIPDALDKCPAIAAQTESGCPAFVAPVVSVFKQSVGKGRYRFSVVCNQPCSITFTGVIGGIKLQPGAGTTTSAAAKRFTIRLTKVNVAKLKKLLRKRSSITGTITVAALDTPSASTTGDVPPSLVAKHNLTITR